MHEKSQVPPTTATALQPKVTDQLKQIGVDAFGIDWRGPVIGVADRGFEVVTDRRVTLSYRPAGGAYFVHDQRAKLGDGGFQGTDSQLISRGKEILSKLNKDVAEASGSKVLQQYTSAAYVAPGSSAFTPEPQKRDRRTLLVTRSIRGIPVWSSELMLDLDPRGQIVSLEISWPKIRPQVLANAIKLREVLRAGYQAPKRKYATVESVEAGILHSPAASFVDDQVAAIRIIYAPTNSRLGKKPVLYLGLDGKPVPIPRQMEAESEKPAPARKGKQQLR
ncbi:MAG: hypothetical protein WCD66_00595 [Rhodanobacteraceae bacterium]